MRITSGLLAGAGTIALGLAGAGFAQDAARTLAEQVEEGRTTYAHNCAACHGADLSGGQFAGALKGADFLTRWGDAPASQLMDYVAASMPPGGSGRLDRADYEAMTALILAENKGDGDLPLAAAMFPPAPEAEDGQGNEMGLPGISSRYPFPYSDPPHNPLDEFTPVTQAELIDPAPENWVNWRRSQLGQGYSPLDQITLDNVDHLQIAWAQALPPGPTMTEPLVRDGVMFMYAYGDEVFAFDATTGRQLWRYRRQMPRMARCCRARRPSPCGTTW